MKNRSVEMYALTVPLEAVMKLTDEQRFAYYLLGHMFNELMCLQKLVSFSLPKHDDRRPARLRPELGQAMFLFRLASGKIWEASKAIREGKQLAKTLVQDILPHMLDGRRRLKKLNAAINAAEWLSPLRNGIGFHFPTFEHWGRHIIPDEFWVDDIVFLSDQSGNTYYDAADTVAQAFMFHQCGVTDPAEAVDLLIGQMIDLLGMMNSFLEDSLITLISKITLDSPAIRKPAGKVLAPEFKHVSMPFWTTMPYKRP